ncbi:unnamed protein product [Blepharisma stoltei]|uniref:Ubiquitinyl hydrolase 1 n=1 Tax=Blepharisma stoltei TaxID=1481888 RepID=A0AAU9K3W1_9CILI|nr:unnamed protein product [Blepharisma stoltei]
MNILKQIKTAFLDIKTPILSEPPDRNFPTNYHKAGILSPKACFTNNELQINSAKELSREEEEQVVRKLDKIKDCNEYYWVEAQWVRDWASYIHGANSPGKLKTAKLKEIAGSIKKDLRIGIDYRALNKEQWIFLSQKYGAEAPVISNSPIYLETKPEEIEPDEPATPRFDATNLKLPTSVRDSEHPKSERNSSEGATLLTTRKETLEVPIIEGDTSSPATEADELEVKSSNESITRSTSNTVNDSEFSFQSSSSLKVRSGRVGLENPGLFCYMNSGLQLLFSIPELKESLLQLNTEFSENNVASILGDICKQIFLGKAKKVRPEALWKYISAYFPLSRQHDLPEFLRFIVNKLETEPPIIPQIFNGLTCSKITCNNCFQVSRKYEPFIDLQFELSSSIEKSFILFTKEERLTANYDCEACNEKSEVSKQFKISKPPSYLLIQVKRFRQIPYPHKVSSTCKYKKRMSIEEFSLEKAEYELLGVAVHNGSIDNGHYLAYCKRGHSWFLYDDAKCTKVSLKEVLNLNAYVLLYKKVETN